MFPIVKHKKFQDLITGKIIAVTDQFEDVAILDSKQRINIKKLLDNSLYEEYIDPESFLNGPSLMALADKIRSIPNEVLDQIKSDETHQTNESLIIPYDEEEERMRLMEKARSMTSAQSMQSQIDKFSHLMDQDEIIPVVEQRQPQVQQQSRVVDSYTEPPFEVPKTTQPYSTENNHHLEGQQTQVVLNDDPIHKMFKNIKRKNNFTFTLTIEDKIPRPDFIEMMEDSYEVSLIDYLAQEFTDKLLSDSNWIKEKIKQEINSLVFPEEKVEEKPEEIIEVKKETKTKTRKKNDSPVTN
jgi:hypothetical protein